MDGVGSRAVFFMEDQSTLWGGDGVDRCVFSMVNPLLLFIRFILILYCFQQSG